MKVTYLTIEGINYIFDNISPTSLYEIEKFGKTPVQVKGHFIRNIGKEFSGIFYTDEGTPQAMIMLELIGKNKWRADIITVNGAWERIGKALNKFLINIGDDLISRTNGMLEAYTPYDDEIHRRWFKSMGFIKDNSYNMTKIFRYFKQVR